MATPRVIFRDKLGKFLPRTARYKPEVAMVQVVRRKEYIIVSERGLKPAELVNVLNQKEFESLPEALIDRGTFISKSKYKAWDIAGKIDKTKGIRRKQLKFTIQLQDGPSKREISFYHQVKRNTESSYALFRRINQELGFENMFLYNKTPGGKVLSDRRGKQVKLLGIKMEEIV